MHTGLTNAQRAAYETEGYVAPVRVLSEAEAADCLQALQEAEARWPDALAGPGRNNAHYVLPLLDALAHHPPVLDAVESIIGEDILVAGTTLFIKEPEHAGFISWHQDARYIGLEPHDWVTAWIALSEVDEQNGCMRMLPGSHRGPLLQHVDTYGEDNLLTRGQTVLGVDEAAAVPVVLRPGELSLHHPRIVHGSGPNVSARRRVGFAIQSYIGANVEQVIGRIDVQQARGGDPYGHHEHRARVRCAMDNDDIAFRDAANERLAAIFYEGAKRRGRF